MLLVDMEVSIEECNQNDKSGYKQNLYVVCGKRCLSTADKIRSICILYLCLKCFSSFENIA